MTIIAVVRNLMVRAGADFSAMRKSMQKAQRDLDNFQKSVARTMNRLKGALAAIGVGAIFRSAIRDAMEFEASVQQIQRLMGESASTFQQWADEQASALGMARSEAMRYGAVFANLISSFTSGTEQTAQYTRDLLRTSAIISAATGRTMEDTMERIRSGMLGSTEAIEDLGINIQVSMLESTEAFRRFAGDKSWNQLDFQTQSLIRYFAILEQASQKYGDELAVNTAGNHAAFVAELKNMQLALGQAFLPVYNIVLPALTQLARALSNVMQFLAAFSQALFGTQQQAQAVGTTNALQDQADAVNAIGEAYEKAGKKARGAVAGFDEVNQLTDPEISGGGSALGGAATGFTTGDTTVFHEPLKQVSDSMNELGDKAKEMAEKVRQAFQEFKESDTVKRLVSTFNEFKETVKGVSQAISEFMSNPNVKKIVAFFANELTKQLIDGLNSALSQMNNLLTLIRKEFELLNEIFSGNFKESLEKIREIIQSVNWQQILDFVEFLINPLKVISERYLSQIYEWLQKLEEKLPFLGSVKKTLSDVWKAIETIDWESVKNAIVQSWNNLKTQTEEKWNIFKQTMANLWEAVRNFVNWDSIKETILLMWDNLKEQTEEKWNAFKQTMSDLWEAVRRFVNWNSIKETILTMWDNLKKETGEKWDSIKTFVKEKWDAISKIDLSSVGKAIMKAWEKIKEGTGQIWTNIANTIIDTINWVIEKVNGFIKTINAIEIKIPTIEIPFVGTFGGGTIGMPKIPELNKLTRIVPKLARGGFVDTATHFGNYIAGEAGRELVVPLENTSFTDKIAAALGTAVMQAMQMSMGQGQGGDVVLQIDGATIARAIKPFLDREDQRLGINTVIQTT